MGKKPKSSKGIAKAETRKIKKADLPEPPPPPEAEHGSSKPLEAPALPGKGFKVIGGDGYDDGGVADLSLLIDLEDSVQRRRRGENEYFTALKADLLPRATKGPMASMTRREQKVSLAQLLFSEDDDGEDKGPSEVYIDQVAEEDDEKTVKLREARLSQARAALRMSLLLRETACASLSLAEICKRKLALSGKAGAEEAFRCAEKSMEIAGDGFWDGDEIAIEAEDSPVVDPKYEKNATTPGLAHSSTLKLLPIRVSHLCLRSSLLQRGNALCAMGKEDEARESYEKVFPLLEEEPRCARVDWERHSLYVNIGNTFSRQGEYDLANEQYKLSEELGNDHLRGEGGSIKDGKAMVNASKRARAFAMKRAGKTDDAKALLKEVVTNEIKYKAEEEAEKKAEEEKKAAEQEAAAKEAKAKLEAMEKK
mmetsp:Transcript_1935/g.2713  ORF Transcript_1935/g.2713 Transcript_1935/m.2713 type:complete len:424 (-) Transcript_1935:73-1344(-)